jgi:DNA polymerase-3 subunit gamma/tau
MSEQTGDDTLPPCDIPAAAAQAHGPEAKGAEQQANPAYRVLARKYRPADFTTLIGQEALVRTLSNAIRTGRLAQAYVLTGVRGVGKTTTARIIARCLNCTGVDGKGGATVEPCGVCDNCRAIAEDRHVDVFEMDAASRTGVGDIRELIESVRYRPTSARYKIYIIDEVHMLSTGAFNALLKTLEEPPEHVKFIFATTEIRKVPVTVLSRCQRFDLRRVTVETLAAHFTRISQTEQATIEDGAIRLIARAADGSVRDGLSLLDQAIAQAGAGSGGEGVVGEEQVRTMLGLADRGLVFDLFDAVMKGDIKTALTLLGEQYNAGADPVVVLNDMLELTHWLTRLKVTPESADDPLAAEAERVRGQAMAQSLSVAILTRTWQMLLKGVAEARSAGAPLQAVEMVLIRLAYAANLPTPGEALARLQQGGAVPTGAGAQASAAPSPQAAGPTGQRPSPPHTPQAPLPAPSMARVGNGPPVATPAPQMVPPQSVPSVQEPPPWAEAAPQTDSYGRQNAASAPPPEDFSGLVALFGKRREELLKVNLERNVHLVRYDPRACRLEFRPTEHAPKDLAGQVSKLLGEWTGRRWGVMVSNAAGEPTLLERTLTGAQANPLVQVILTAFPQAKIGVVRDLQGANSNSLPMAPPPDPDDFDGDLDSYGAYDPSIDYAFDSFNGAD